MALGLSTTGSRMLSSLGWEKNSRCFIVLLRKHLDFREKYFVTIIRVVLWDWQSSCTLRIGNSWYVLCSKASQALRKCGCDFRLLTPGSSLACE